ncbi:MAG TPA: hypothetical protein VG406_20210 [Isosphaeraceae bacterium]|nr:hypothetical protein [Isosphaeraceae bacterium]
MSHIVTIRAELRDPAAVAAACRRLGLPEPVHGTATLFSGEAAGLLVRLPDWLYPAVVHLETGRVEFDNYNEAWGRREHLDRLLQAYAVEKARIEARKRGHAVVEQALADGSVKLTVTVGGAS